MQRYGMPNCCDDLKGCRCTKARTWLCTYEFATRRPRSIHSKRI